MIEFYKKPCYWWSHLQASWPFYPQWFSTPQNSLSAFSFPSRWPYWTKSKTADNSAPNLVLRQHSGILLWLYKLWRHSWPQHSSKYIPHTAIRWLGGLLHLRLSRQAFNSNVTHLRRSRKLWVVLSFVTRRNYLPITNLEISTQNTVLSKESLHNLPTLQLS